MPDEVALERQELPRRLGVWDAAAIYVGIILGSGIFVAPAAVAAAAPGWLAAASLWILAGLLAGCGALCYAECAARLPRSGGFYVFYREAYGGGLAFVAGWAALLLTYPASVAAIADIFARYLGELAPALAPWRRGLAASAVVASGFVHAAGVRAGAWTQQALTGLKVAAMAILCAAAFALGEGPGAGSSWGELSLEPSALLACVVLLLWTYDGWSDVTLVAGEIRDPGRNLGRAVALGTVTLVLLYVGVQLAVHWLLPAPEAAASEQVFARAVSAVLGPAGAQAVAALIVLSTFGSIHGIVLTASRLAYAMARDGVLPRWFGTVHRRWGTPVRSIGVLVGATAVYCLAARFQALLELFSLNVWLFYGLTAAALAILRRRGIGEPVAWRAPGGALVPALVGATALGMTTALGLQNPRGALWSGSCLMAGYLVYRAWRSASLRIHSRASGRHGGPSR